MQRVEEERVKMDKFLDESEYHKRIREAQALVDERRARLRRLLELKAPPIIEAAVCVT